VKKGLLVIIISLVVAVPVGLFGYGYKQGEKLGENGSSDIAAGIIALSMNPISQTGFKSGYLAGLTKKQELDEWSKEYFGPWEGWSSKDEITDFDNHYLTNEGDIGPYSKKASLKVRCVNDKTEVYILWGSYLTGTRDGKLNVTHRIDSKKAIHSDWALSTDKTGFFYNGKNIGFIKSLIGRNKLVVQFADRTTRTISFDLSKLQEKVQPLAKACHWKV
jgi:type VI secretion system VasI family protein